MENEESVLVRKPSQVITQTLQQVIYHLYIHDFIGSADEFMEHFAVLHQASSNDLVKLYINSGGGSLATTMQIISHIKQCQAPVIGVIGLECASGASAIALACDGWEVDNFSTMLVHGFSYGTAGGAWHVNTKAAFNAEMNEKWVREIYTGFLTEEEIRDAVRNTDVLIHSDSLSKRLKALAELRELENEVENSDDKDE